MSLGWKKFNFFSREDRPDVQLPADVCCSSSAKDEVFFGCRDGNVVCLNRNFRQVASFQAHSSSLVHVHRSKTHDFLVTVGSDVQEGGGGGSACLRVWALDTGGGSSSGGGNGDDDGTGQQPMQVKSIRLFGGKAAEVGPLHCVAVHEDGWPSLAVAYGVGTGGLGLLKGDMAHERVQRSVLLPQEQGGVGAHPLTLLHFTGGGDGGDGGGGGGGTQEGAPLQLFAMSSLQTRLVDCSTGNVAVLDESGCAPGCGDANERGELALARREAVYVYTADGRGPCFVFDGPKQRLAWCGSNLVLINGPPHEASPQHTVQVYDMRNRLVACTAPLGALGGALDVAYAFGQVLVVEDGGRLMVLRERVLSSKLDALFSKNLFAIALGVAQAEQADVAVLADIHRRYGDHLYHKHDYDAAVQQYAATIGGGLEPSYVIRRFLDAQRIHNLTHYLEALHERGSASADHTTLLLNCYAKLRDVGKLDRFIRATDAAGRPALSFDVETAIQVLRGAGYYDHALFVASAAGEPGLHLDILVDDMCRVDDALAYLQGGLTRKEAAAALQRHGKVLITARPEATTALLMMLCTVGDRERPDGEWVAQVSDFAHLYSDRPLALMLLCEFILNSSAAPPNEQMLYHTLLDLYLQEEDLGGAAGDCLTTDKHPASASKARRRESALELLRRGWQSGADPKYDVQHALVVCRMHSFRPGLMFLYQTLRLYREVLHVLMAEGDSAALIDVCVRLGDASRGGDPQLWTELLEYFGGRDQECAAEIQEVLGHIEAGGLLPPLLVVQALARNHSVRLEVVRDYVARTLALETQAVEEDCRQIDKYKAETSSMQAELANIRGQPRVLQNSKCALSGGPLELPAVHFLCGHSFNLRAMPDPEGRECPLCAPGFRTVLDIRRSMQTGGAEQDRFFSQLHGAADGFSVVADFFGRGLLNHTSVSRDAAGAVPAMGDGGGDGFL